MDPSSKELCITRSQVIDAIRASVARGSATPTLPIDADRDAYLAEKGRALEQAVIDPERAIVRSVTFEAGLLERIVGHACFVVARSQQHQLGFIPATGDFFLAFGTDAGDLEALGFYSDDALAEWLG